MFTRVQHGHLGSTLLLRPMLCSQKNAAIGGHTATVPVDIDQATVMAAASAQCVLLATSVRHSNAPTRSGLCTASRAASAAKQRRACDCRSASGQGPAAAQHMPAVEQAALAADPAALAALVEDAVVWASQHGLVGAAAAATAAAAAAVVGSCRSCR